MDNKSVIIALIIAILLNTTYYALASNTLVDEGNRYLGMAEYGRALASFDRAISSDPDDKSAWLGKGIALFNLGDINESVKSFDRALSIDPEYKLALYHKAVVYIYIEDCTAALALLDRVLEIDPSNTAAADFRERCSARGRLCRTNLGENCANTEQCRCPEMETCSPEHKYADIYGCYIRTCGNKKVDHGETADNCCLDMGCDDDLICTDKNRCVECISDAQCSIVQRCSDGLCVCRAKEPDIFDRIKSKSIFILVGSIFIILILLFSSKHRRKG